MGQGQRSHRVSYRRADIDLALEVDLMQWRLLGRSVRGEDPGWPMLESPMARQQADGDVTVGNAQLTTPAGAPAWLFSPHDDLAVAAFHGLEPGRVTLKLRGGEVRVDAMGTGTIVWQDGQVTVDAIDVSGIEVDGGELASAP